MPLVWMPVGMGRLVFGCGGMMGGGMGVVLGAMAAVELDDRTIVVELLVRRIAALSRWQTTRELGPVCRRIGSSLSFLGRESALAIESHLFGRLEA